MREQDPLLRRDPPDTGWHRQPQGHREMAPGATGTCGWDGLTPRALGGGLEKHSLLYHDTEMHGGRALQDESKWEGHMSPRQLRRSWENEETV